MGWEAFYSFSGLYVGGVNENIKQGFIEISFSHVVTHTHTDTDTHMCTHTAAHCGAS